MVVLRSYLLALVVFLILTGCGSPPSDVQGATAAAPVAATLAPSESLAAAGLLLPNGLRPTPELLVGGQPTAEQMQRIAEEGYRTVVNLRMPGEKGNVLGAADAEVLGMHYFSLPVDGRSGPTEEQARRLSEILAAEDALPAMVHCAAGGRVGAILALEAFWVDGATSEAALEVGRKSGMDYMEPTVRKIMESQAAREEGSGT